jgi:hypothetical protein
MTTVRKRVFVDKKKEVPEIGEKLHKEKYHNL